MSNEDVKDLKIVELQVENFKRISLAHIKPNGDLVVVGGKNAQGKSSVIDAIFAALKGKSFVPGEPIHEGAEEGCITLDLGEYIAERKFKEGGKTTLVVKTKEGARFNSPQDLLNKFIDNLGFDPHEFKAMDAKKQCQAIASITGIDFSDFAARRKDVFDERTNVNRHLKEVEAQLAGIIEGKDETVGTEVKSMVDLSKKLTDAVEHNKSIDDLVDVESKSVNHCESLGREVLELKSKAGNRSESLSQEVLELEKKVASLKQQQIDDLLELEKNIESHKKKQLQAKAELDNASKQIADAKRIDITEINTEIENIEATNKKVELQVNIAATEQRVTKGRTMADDLTARIKTIDTEKENAIAAVEMPVPGLDIADGVVLLNDHPFDQASSAEQIRACVMIGLAMNPQLRVLIIRDGSLLDEDNLKLIAELAAEQNAQVWIERVGAGEEVGFVMEDGKVK